MVVLQFLIYLKPKRTEKMGVGRKTVKAHFKTCKVQLNSSVWKETEMLSEV